MSPEDHGPSHYYSRYVSPANNTAFGTQPYASPGAALAAGPTSPHGNAVVGGQLSTELGQCTPMAPTLAPALAPPANLTPPAWNWTMYNPATYYPGAYMTSPTQPYGRVNNGGIAVTPQATPGAVPSMPYYPGYLPVPYLQYPMSMGDCSASPTVQQTSYEGGAEANTPTYELHGAEGVKSTNEGDPASTA